MKNKEVTIEGLVRVVKKGFEQTVTKKDVQRLEGRLDALEQGQEDINV